MKRKSEDTGKLLDIDVERLLVPLTELADCAFCPRDCHANRVNGEPGYCHTGAGFSVASIFAHRGEEPVLSGKHGICNIFFTGCNMQCAYCQNYQISRMQSEAGKSGTDLSEIVRQIETILNAGSRAVGFVSPSHVIPQVKIIIAALRKRGHNPVFVFNTNAYDKQGSIASLDGMIDVWLPDLKYMDEGLGRLYSDTSNYPEIATAAIKQMYDRVGYDLRLDDDGSIESGLVIRHLVLPGQVENSKAVLRWIAEELSPSVHISLMSQYHPIPLVAGHSELGRTLRAEEYAVVLEESERLGFDRGWIQKLDSSEYYRPDFNRPDPFEP